MGLYQFLKRALPTEWKDRWKVRLHSTKTFPKDIAVRVWNRLSGGAPIPSGDFIYLVSGHRSASRFLRRGRVASKTIRQTLARNGIEIERFNTILDFGCGVGRIMRHWKLLQSSCLYGTDYNPTLVRWCEVNLKFAEFRVNSLSDRLPYEAETFDFIYAYSVFTHLSEPLQFFWINELSRVLKPGGYFYFTTHGDFFFSQLNADEKQAFLDGQLVVRGAEQSGSNTCSTYHPVAFVRENLARKFSVLDFIPGRTGGDILQDIYLLTKPTRVSMASPRRMVGA
jgi:SAM-dependent methyltransferase